MLIFSEKNMYQKGNSNWQIETDFEIKYLYVFGLMIPMLHFKTLKNSEVVFMVPKILFVSHEGTWYIIYK